VPKAPEIKEVRERYSDYTAEWREIREEAAIDMRYVDNDPWDPDDKSYRDDNGRPCISHDEINQYLNQAINNVRQNKLAIKIAPQGLEDQGDTAAHRAAIIRGGEDRCNAETAYITAYENAIQRGYGFAEITTEYDDENLDTNNLNPSAFEQQISVRRIPNPDTILIPSNYKKADASDIEDAFKVSIMTIERFKRKYPKAQKKDFTDEDRKEAVDWIREKDIQIGTYWMAHKKTQKIVLIDGGEQGPIVQIDDGHLQGVKVLKSRTVEIPEVVQYILNGVEILLETPWAGSRIPIAACFGKEIFVPDAGGSSKRKLISMVRAARDPQMSLAFLVSQEMEEAGLTPRVPYIGYKGQFTAPEWKELHKVAHPYAEVDMVPDASGTGVLPLPQRNPFVPNFQVYEIAKDSARRAIQAAMGITPLPTAAQRSTQKSGVALERIAQQEAVGTFHFTDNYKLFIENIGWQWNQLLGKVVDTARTMPAKKDNGERTVIRVNDPQFAEQNPDKDHISTADGQFGVSITTGPNYESQRAEASDFVDNLLQNIQMIAQLIGPQAAAKLMALGIKLKEIGPLGEEMAELLSPPDPNNIPPQAQAAIQQAHGIIQQLQQELQQLQMEKQAKVVDNQAKMLIEKMKIDAQIAVAEIETKAQRLNERIAFVEDLAGKVMDQQHAHQLAAQQAQNQAQQSSQDQAEALQSGDQSHQQALEQGAQSHDQALEQQDQAGQQAMAQQEQAAELAPKPEANSGN
jgi:hypothetical protein